MQKYTLPNTDIAVSHLAYGCMNIGGRWDRSPITSSEEKRAIAAVETAYEAGINCFDHADIYTFGKSEQVFAALWQAIPGFRDNIILQTKCGIRFAGAPPGAPHRYDFSFAHIVDSVEQSLERLRTDRLDILLLHRPDILIEPEEVARAFFALHAGGKVAHFGVSNFTPGQIALLQHTIDQPLVINQVELSLLHAHLLDEGIMFNQSNASARLAEGAIDYCRLHDIAIQAWSPAAGGRIFADIHEVADPGLKNLVGLILEMAENKQTSREAIALSWLLRHPARIQPVIGTLNPDRIRASALADASVLSREEWYRLFTAARGATLP